MYNMKLLLIIILLDFLYLNIVSTYMNNTIKNVQKTSLNLNYISIFLCYVLLAFGMDYFVIKPRRSNKDAMIFGVVVYGVFELTCKSIFTNWPINIVLLDTIWGGCLCLLSRLILNYL